MEIKTIQGLPSYGADGRLLTKIEVTLTKEDVDKLSDAYEGIRQHLIIDSFDVRPLVAFMYKLLSEAERGCDA